MQRSAPLGADLSAPTLQPRGTLRSARAPPKPCPPSAPGVPHQPRGPRVRPGPQISLSFPSSRAQRSAAETQAVLQGLLPRPSPPGPPRSDAMASVGRGGRNMAAVPRSPTAAGGSGALEQSPRAIGAPARLSVWVGGRGRPGAPVGFCLLFPSGELRRRSVWIRAERARPAGSVRAR